MSAAQKLGRPPPPIAENKLFNVGLPTVTLLVEGGNDERFWRTHVHPGCLVRVEPGGREGALRAVQAVVNNPKAVIVACVDADLDRVRGAVEAPANVFFTDAHDLETTLLTRPGLLEKLVARVVGPSAWCTDLVERLLQFVRPAAVLRWLRAEQDERVMPLKLHKEGKRGRVEGRFDKWDKLVTAELRPDAEAFLQQLIAYNTAQRLLSELPTLANALRAGPDAPDDQLCNGHDCIGALRAWLQLHGAERRGDDEALTERLMDCCERAHLSPTTMWRAMVAWQATRPRHPLLRDEDRGAAA